MKIMGILKKNRGCPQQEWTSALVSSPLKRPGTLRIPPETNTYEGQPIFRSTLIGPKVVLMVVARRVLYLHCCWKASNRATC